jgi:hypothetical protein
LKIFISHSSTDKKFARKLKDDLKENSFTTWVDEDELDFGDSLIDKLEAALEESSHFLIILSPASVNSEWVKFELAKALKKKDNHLVQKIIPIKYSNCELPKELEKLVYADLTAETRRIQGGKVFFVTDGYDNFLDKLCKTIRNSEQKLTNIDKIKIKNELVKQEIQDSISHNPAIIKANYTIKSYKNSAINLKYVKIIEENIEPGIFTDRSQIKPVLLPPLLKNAFLHIKLGDKIDFNNNYLVNDCGHFAGYRKDDLGITLDHRIRKGLSIRTGLKYNAEIDIDKLRITFLT